jgi:ABC-2 type transport system permease protein
MRTILAIVKKEFLQVFRNKVLSKIIFIVPVIQLIVLVYAANFEVKNLSLGFIDRDNSSISHEVKNHLQASGYFILKDVPKNYTHALESFENNNIDVIVEIPANFHQDIVRGLTPRIAVSVNAINSMKAGLASSYVGSVISQIGEKIAKIHASNKVSIQPTFNVTYSNWFNPKLDYKSYMLPGVLCVLITVIGILLTALNIVREKEVGTIEQLNVTPIRKIQFVVGKLLPFGIISVIQLTLGLLVAAFVFGLKIQGSLLLIYGIVTVYMFAILGIGFLISTISETQSQAMFVTLFSMFLLILLSGLFTPIESMPSWAQKITIINPTAYLVDAIRMIILKGSSFSQISMQFLALSLFAIVVNSAVVLSYRKVS